MLGVLTAGGDGGGDRVTTAIQPGDLVVLTWEGCNRFANELMAIWTMKNVRDDSAKVEMQPGHQTVEDLPILSVRRYLLNWLVLYTPETK